MSSAPHSSRGVRHGVGHSYLAACLVVGALRELGRGRSCIQAKRRERNALGGWAMSPRPSWITTTPSRDLSYFGILITT